MDSILNLHILNGVSTHMMAGRMHSIGESMHTAGLGMILYLISCGQSMTRLCSLCDVVIPRLLSTLHAAVTSSLQLD